MTCTTRRIVTVFLVVAIAATFVGQGIADLPPPIWVPGFPLVAGTRLMLMWAPVTGAVRYKVVVNRRTIGETPSFQFLLQAPESAGEYGISVVAIDTEGKESPPSREWMTRIDKLAPPSTVFFRVLDTGAVSLRWEPVPGAVIYNLFKREGAQGENKPVASVLAIAYTDYAVKKDAEVFYTVSARDSSGRESVLSDPIKVVVAGRENRMATAFRDLVPITSTVVKRIRDFDLGGRRIRVRNPGGVVEHGGNFYYTEILSGKVCVLERRSYGGVRVFGGAENDEGAIRRAIGIETDGNGNLYIADAFGGKIVKYSPDGKFLKNIYIPAHTQERMGHLETRDAGPVDLRFLDDGTLAVVDNSGNRILLLDGDGRVLKTLHSFTDGKTTTGLKRPTAIDVDSVTGDLYIADALNNRIMVVGKDGKFLRTIGEPGDIVGTFSGLLGLALDVKRGWVVAVDARCSNLQIFDMKTGKYLFSVAGEKPDAPIEISKPQRIRRLSDGSFILTEGLVDMNGGGLLEFRVTDP